MGTPRTSLLLGTAISNRGSWLDISGRKGFEILPLCRLIQSLELADYWQPRPWQVVDSERGVGIVPHVCLPRNTILRYRSDPGRQAWGSGCPARCNGRLCCCRSWVWCSAIALQRGGMRCIACVAVLASFPDSPSRSSRRVAVPDSGDVSCPCLGT